MADSDTPQEPEVAGKELNVASETSNNDLSEKKVDLSSADGDENQYQEPSQNDGESEARENDNEASEETVSKRRKLNAELPDAFSRRESGVPSHSSGTSSVYSGEKEAPAWLNNNQLADKYGKYGGARPQKYDVPKSNDRYSKYGANNDDRYSKYSTGESDRYSKYDTSRSASGSTSGSNYSKYGVKEDRYSKYSGSNDDDSKVEPEVETEVAAAPYANLSIANPSHIHVPGEEDNSYQTFRSHISNRDQRDINSIVRQHYNQRTRVSKYQGSRTKSPIYKLRNFNNIIKYILLGNHVRRASPDQPLSILDLCCGKGGDLNKCEFVQVDQYIGIDISDASVKEAFSRYSQQKARFRPQHGKVVRDSRRYNFEACFATGDCFSKTIPEILEPNFSGIIDSLFPVDCVSAQFALHYSFETEDKIRTLLTNVSRSLRPGGKFIGTIPSSDFIKDKILRKDYMVNESSDKVKFGNNIYSVTFDSQPPVDGIFRPPFGNGYTYYLQDAVDNVPEYVVPFETLRALCEEYGLTLQYKKNFIDIFNQEIPKYFSKLNKNLIEGIKRSDGKFGVEGNEKDAVAFYLGFVFEKLP
jgi:mRNA (guanine-N7-)-methyltransferase